jgi:hypothetical protein
MKSMSEPSNHKKIQHIFLWIMQYNYANI